LIFDPNHDDKARLFSHICYDAQLHLSCREAFDIVLNCRSTVDGAFITSDARASLVVRGELSFGPQDRHLEGKRLLHPVGQLNYLLQVSSNRNSF